MTASTCFRFNPIVHALVASATLLTACGGGGGTDDSSTSTSPTPSTPVAQTRAIEGTAAVGSALGKANVTISDTSGGAVCVESTIVTSATGSYACTLQDGKAAPFLVVVTDPSGAFSPLVSVGTVTPAAGMPLTVNATPLTTAIVGQLAPDHNALAVIATPSLLDTAALALIKQKVLAQLADVLRGVGAPAGYDPFTTPIVAATTSLSGNTADQVIDVLKIVNVNGTTTVSTIDNPNGAVALATATSSAALTLAAASATVVTLADAVKRIATGFNDCFALPAASRVVAKDATIPYAQGGAEVTALAGACQNIAKAGYLHNGYRFGQALYGLLNDPNMDRAEFRVPEIMRFIDDTSAADNDRVIINIRYTDRNGNAGNLITIAEKFPGSSTTAHASDWWAWGNQQVVDTSVKAFLRRNEQLAPNAGAGAFINASNSRYESGIDIFVNKDGPGSTGLRAARVTGPGLPPAGLVLTRPNAAICTTQNWLNIQAKDGNTDPRIAVPATDVGNIFRLQRTLGVSGADATTVRPNPNAGNANTTAYPAWAHPLDYGQAAGSTSYIDFSALKANTNYLIELFYEGETVARYSVEKTLLTPVVPATRGSSVQWIGLTQETKAYLDPANARAAATASIALGWQANPLAETIASAGVYTFTAQGSVNQGEVGVVRGSTSATATAPGLTATCAGGMSFPALTDDGSTGRQFQLRYRVLDGSYKDSMTRFN